MISNLSLSAFSATDLRPPTTRPPDRGEAPRAPSQRPPVEAPRAVSQIRSQSETRAAQDVQQLGSPPPAPSPGRPAPRGSLLDLSV